MIAHRSSWVRAAAALAAVAMLAGASACSHGSTASSPPRTVRYMPLGDSITAGQGLPGAYRTVLWQDLVERDHDRIDFVGSQTGEGPPALGDQDHEGHGGWCIAGTCYGDAQKTVLPHITGWLQTYRPDIVSIHLGTNDIGRGASGQETADRLDRLVGLIYAYNPDTIVVLIQIIPMNKRFADHDQYDALIPGLATKYRGQGRRVSVVDMSHLLTYPQDYRDGYHPTQAGFDTMGQALYPAISNAYRELA